MLSRICLACEHANAADAKFCSECGSPLQIKFCSHCRKVNDYAAHFCQGCGQSLPHVAVESDTAAPPANARTEPGSPPAGEARGLSSTPARPMPATPTIVRAFAPGAPTAAANPTSKAEPMVDPFADPAPALVFDATDIGTYQPPVVIETRRAADPARRSSAARLLGGVVVLLVIAAVVILSMGRGRAPAGSAAPGEAAGASTPAGGRAPAGASAATAVSPPAPAETPDRAAVATPVPPSPAVDGEPKEQSPRAESRRPPTGAAAPAVRPRPPPAPAVARDCTPALAALGLCAGEKPTEGK